MQLILFLESFSFDHALAALLFVLAALLPFSFYRTHFMCGRYFYLAGVGAVYLIYLSSSGVSGFIQRFLSVKHLGPSLVTVLLAGWIVFSIQGIREETRQVYQRACGPSPEPWRMISGMSWFLCRIDLGPVH
ncbi:MAG: hypothetical protein ABIK28_10675 [Planctomycetota bacterium]